MCSGSAALDTFPRMQNSGRRLVALGALSLVVLALSAPVAGAAPGTPSRVAAAAASDAITIEAGINDRKNPTVAVTEFLPAEVSVPVGATLTWSWARAVEPHSVTFFPSGVTPPPPGSDRALFAPTPPTGPYNGSTLVNSGLQPLGATPPPFSITFDTAGDFPYYCVIHPNMIGTVKVVEGTEKVDTPATAKSRALEEGRRWVAEGRAAARKLAAAKPKSTKAGDGSVTWDVEMGTTTEHTDILAFAPAPAKVKAGDNVRFVNNSQAPHTGTFSGRQEAITDPLAPETSTAIPGPSPQTLNSTDLFNTGELPPNAGNPPPPIEARSYTYLVPTAGTYDYYCILHVASGMASQIRATGGS